MQNEVQSNQNRLINEIYVINSLYSRVNLISNTLSTAAIDRYTIGLKEVNYYIYPVELFQNTKFDLNRIRCIFLFFTIFYSYIIFENNVRKYTVNIQLNCNDVFP